MSKGLHIVRYDLVPPNGAAHSFVIALDPDTFEVPRVKEKAATYGVGPSKMKQAYCYIMLTKQTVNLGFFHATSLSDPDGRLEGTGAKMRHLKLREQADLEDPYVRGLLVDAIEERRR